MRSGAGLVCVAVALALAGCGGGKKAPTAITKPKGLTTSSSPEAPSAQYTVHLVGRPAGATGLAVIDLYTPGETLCWTFSHLAHLTEPKTIVITGFVRGTGAFKAPLGRFKAEGCRPNTPKIFLGIVQAHPHNFEVVIRTKRLADSLHERL
jgi:hypothetical protein